MRRALSTSFSPAYFGEIAVGNTAVVSVAPHSSRRKSAHFLPFSLPATLASRYLTEHAGTDIADFFASAGAGAPGTAAACEGDGLDAASGVGLGLGAATGVAGVVAWAMMSGAARPGGASIIASKKTTSVAAAPVPNRPMLGSKWRREPVTFHKLSRPREAQAYDGPGLLSIR